MPLAVSAFLTSRKKAAAAELADWIDSPEGRASSLESIGRSLSRRNHGRSRAVVMAHDHDEAVKALRALADGKQNPSVYSADGPVTNGPVWVLAGFGAQHRKMAKSLYLRDETFAEWIDKVDSLVQDELGYSIVELILDDSQDYGIETTQVTIFAIQIALGELLKHHGAKPGAVVGQSLGEAAAAYFAGGLSLADATRTICSRSHLMGEGEAMLFGEYIRLMALVEYSAEEIKTVFSDYPDLEVCVYAAPTQTVIGGPPDQVDAIIERAEKEGKFARKFQTKGASHTQQMDPLLGELAAELQGIEPRPLTTGYFSTVHEGSYIRPGGEPIHGVDYWKKGLRHSVYFTHGIRNAVDNGHTTFLELAPNPVALMQVGLTTASAGLHDGQLIATLARKQDEVDAMTAAMAQLFVYGHDLDFRTLFRPRRVRRHPADPVPPQAALARCEVRGRQLVDDAGQPRRDARRPPRVGVPAEGLDRSWRTGESSCGAGSSGSQAHRVRTARRARRWRPLRDYADPPSRRCERAGARPHRRVVHPGLRRRRQPRRTGGRAAHRRRSGRCRSCLRGHRGAAEVPPAGEEDAEILSDYLTQGANLGAGFEKWSADSGETIGQRLGAIVGGAMGYEPEDLPWEVPLIELGLDSLMAVRIKNRVEYDFDLPPIQLTAVRDANLYAVEKLIEYAIEHRDEVEELHEHQKTLTPEEIAAEQAAVLAGAAPVAAPRRRQRRHRLWRHRHPRPTCGTAIPPPPTNPAGPDQQSAAALAALGPRAERRGVLTQEAVTEALGADVPPREAAERVTFATWAIVTGKSPGGIFNALPELDDETAEKLAARLTERADGTITVEDVKNSPTIEALASIVREHLEAGEIDGFVRVLRAAKEGSDSTPVFVFHPAGGSTVVYEPLLKRLPADTPMYGIERVEGSVEERAAEYVPKLLEMQGNGPFILAGWSLGGVLAYACAIGLRRAGADVRFVGLIDAVRAGEEVPQTKEETRARWERYARFAERTFNVQVPAIPYEQLEELDDEGQVQFVLDAVSQSGVQIPGGVIEHQRTSYLDNRVIDTAKIEHYDGHVTLYMADRYHDDAIFFEPRYATRQPDGGWGDFVSELEVVPIGGEHIQAIDEPYIAKVGAHMSEAINRIDAEEKQAK